MSGRLAKDSARTCATRSSPHTKKPPPAGGGFFVSSRLLPRCPGVDFLSPPTGTYLTEPRLPLLTLAEARDAVRLLMHLADDSVEGREARDLAADIGVRLPTE